MEGNEGNIIDVIRAIEYAESIGVDVINCSWGWTEKKYNYILEDFIKNSNMIFVFSSGNKNKETEFYPACLDLDNIISVTGINYCGYLDPSLVSSETTFAAPGTAILTTLPENQYSFFGGTSASAPFVSGVIALLKSCNPKLSNKELVILINKYRNKTNSTEIINAYDLLKYINNN